MTDEKNRLSTDEQKDVQREILRHFAAFCDAHGLTYYLCYGTLIGAARHRGYIPWDDDIDVMMPRTDYERLMDIYPRENQNEAYRLISPYDKISRHSFVKVTDTRTEKRERGFDYKNGTLGVDIDVFPLDAAPATEAGYRRLSKRLMRRYFFYSLAMMEPAGHKIHTRFAITLTKLFFDKNRAQRKIDAIIRRAGCEGGDYLCDVCCEYNIIKAPYRRAWFAGTAPLPFEGMTIAAPAGYDAVLRHRYGDYMQLPPEEQRITHHDNHCYLREGAHIPLKEGQTK
jgi:lipopolysaccharide cholinephosphotransferase